MAGCGVETSGSRCHAGGSQESSNRDDDPAETPSVHTLQPAPQRSVPRVPRRCGRSRIDKLDQKEHAENCDMQRV